MILILLILTIFYSLSYYPIYQIILLLFVLFYSLFNYNSLEFKVIKLVIWKLIILVIVLNIIAAFYHFDLFLMSIIMPLATDRITFEKEFEYFDWEDKVGLFLIRKFTPIEIIRFFGCLELDETYICAINLIPDGSKYHKSNPVIWISESFFINKNVPINLIGDFILKNDDVKHIRKDNMDTVIIIHFSKVLYYK
jgi:hypothetical protein